MTPSLRMVRLIRGGVDALALAEAARVGVIAKHRARHSGTVGDCAPCARALGRIDARVAALRAGS